MMTNQPDSIASGLRARIGVLSVSRLQVAREAHMDPKTLTAYLSGLKLFTASPLQRITAALDRIESQQKETTG